MLQSQFDIQSMLFGLLSTKVVKGAINGGIYISGQRPTNSDKEDIEINVLSITIDSCPQQAIANINCYVPDKEMRVNGSTVTMQDANRMKSISETVLMVVRNNIVDGMLITPENMHIYAEPTIKQHYVNIRLFINISK